MAFRRINALILLFQAYIDVNSINDVRSVVYGYINF